MTFVLIAPTNIFSSKQTTVLAAYASIWRSTLIAMPVQRNYKLTACNFDVQTNNQTRIMKVAKYQIKYEY